MIGFATGGLYGQQEAMIGFATDGTHGLLSPPGGAFEAVSSILELASNKGRLTVNAGKGRLTIGANAGRLAISAEIEGGKRS